jgi:hypothetical protein
MHFLKESVLEITILILISGSLFLAVIDANNRPLFADLAKICLGAYIGQSLPKSKA